MTPDETELMVALCKRIQDEKNPASFIELIEELNALLEQKRGRSKIRLPLPDRSQVTQQLSGAAQGARLRLTSAILASPSVMAAS